MSASSSHVDLMHRLESGDPDAAAVVFDRYARRLIGLARGRLDERVRPKVDADDVVNSVIRTFCRRAAAHSFHFDGAADLWALLVEITLRKCGHWNRHFRTRKRDVRREQAPPSSEDTSFTDEPPDPSGPRPEDEAVLRETLEHLLHRLDAKARAVCEMRLQGYEIKEIATALKSTETTINRKIRQIKDRMRELWPELLV